MSASPLRLTAESSGALAAVPQRCMRFGERRCCACTAAYSEGHAHRVCCTLHGEYSCSLNLARRAPAKTNGRLRSMPAQRESCKPACTHALASGACDAELNDLFPLSFPLNDRSLCCLPLSAANCRSVGLGGSLTSSPTSSRRTPRCLGSPSRSRSSGSCE